MPESDYPVMGSPSWARTHERNFLSFENLFYGLKIVLAAPEATMNKAFELMFYSSVMHSSCGAPKSPDPVMGWHEDTMFLKLRHFRRVYAGFALREHERQ